MENELSEAEFIRMGAGAPRKRGGRGYSYSDDDISAALSANYGNVSAAARALNCSANTIYNRLRDKPELKTDIQRGRRAFVDLAHAQLMKHLAQANDGNGDIRAIRFVLETWGKDDGWTKRRELTGADGAPLIDLPADVRQYLAAQGIDDQHILTGLIGELISQVRAIIGAPAAAEEQKRLEDNLRRWTERAENAPNSPADAFPASTGMNPPAIEESLPEAAYDASAPPQWQPDERARQLMDKGVLVDQRPPHERPTSGVHKDAKRARRRVLSAFRHKPPSD